MTSEEQIVLSTLGRAWRPKTVQWVSNGCALGLRDCENTLHDLTARGDVARVKRNGIDEYGLDYVYDAYILSCRATGF